MKGKNIIMIILLLIVILAISATVFLGIKYKNASIEVENLKVEIAKLNEQISSEEKEPEVEQEIVEEFKNIKYDSNKIINSDNTYSEACSVGNTRGTLSISGSKLTFSVVNSATDYSYSVTYDAKEPIVDAVRGIGGQGVYEITAIVTESGRVYINYDNQGDELVEVSNLPKICKVVHTASTSKDGIFLGGTVIAIDEEGNGYDLLKTNNN